ncbi:MAG: OmpA family protein [Bacteroidales bacterium]|nr:PD40 domain-containing protein [Bacteroidales bacterium]
MRTLIILFITAISFSSLHAQQQYSTSSGRAAESLEEALRNYRIKEYDKALGNIGDALDRDDSFIEAYIVRGQIYEAKENDSLALDSYKEAIGIDPDFFPKVLYSAGLIGLKMGKYAQAKEYFNRFIGKEDIGPIFEEKANKHIRSCNFAREQLNDPVPFDPKNLGDNVNSEYDEYWPSISADGQTLVFTRLIPREDLDEVERRMEQMDEGRKKFMESLVHKRQEDFFISSGTDTGWSEARNLGYPINTKNNEGAQSLSADGKTMYFTACNQKGGEGGCDIYYARLTETGWSDPVNLGAPVNTKHWESQPSISPDGQTLYFSSNRDNGKGKKDLWKSTRQSDGSWGEPVNLGDSINTPENEVAPFIHMDNETLYFASDGWPGMGSLDLFKSRKTGENSWEEPKNLGYPINTHKSEFGLIVNSQGTDAFYASDRQKGKGKDIFRFRLYREIRPTPSAYMRGKVYDSETSEPLKAKFELISLGSGDVVMESYSDEQSGEFLVCIPSNNNYVLNVSKEGYLFYSDNFTLKGVHEVDEPYKKDVPLDPVKEGQRIILRNVFYATDSFNLKSESRVELNKLYQFLVNNSGLKIEISGHTDNVGSEEYNMELSEKRARSVYDYLVEKGIDPERLSYKGYGESEPVATNETEEGRAQNRRTEIKILDNL